jgi:hypothetical protein
MAPGPSPSVSTDWVAAFQQTQIPVARHNLWAAGFAAAAGFLSFVLAVVSLWGG